MRKCRNYWTKERCIIEAKKYKLKSVFKVKSGGAYNASIKSSWLEEICSHMSIVGNKFRRLVYVYEFKDKTIYVGLTYNIEERDNKHRRDKRSSVYNYIQESGLNPELTYSNYIEVEDAKKLEGEKIKYYKNKGYNVLNKAESGAVGGGNLKWTKEKCLEEAKKCNYRKEFYNTNNSAYNSARNNGWLDEVCFHMPEVNKYPKGYWTKEKSIEEALKYKTKNEFYNKSGGAYMFLLRNGWLHDVCTHMKRQKPNGYWTKEKCVEEALKYETRADFRKYSGSAYHSSRLNGWLSDIYYHINGNKFYERKK